MINHNNGSIPRVQPNKEATLISRPKSDGIKMSFQFVDCKLIYCQLAIADFGMLVLVSTSDQPSLN